MTILKPPLAVGPDAAPRVRAVAPSGGYYSMWMWRCAVVLPHPALHAVPDGDLPRAESAPRSGSR